MANTPAIDTDIHPVPDAVRVAARLPDPWRRRYLSDRFKEELVE